MSNPTIEIQLQTLPNTPGVYQFYDATGVVIYVGKAKNLKNRVRSYFNKVHDYGKTNVLVKKIVEIKHIVVETETDALLLENNLIKKYSFGGGVVNDTVIHFSNTNLPFGGIGTSGNGSYHGKYSFDIFTHAKPLVKRPFWFDLPQRYAPYPKSLKFLKFLLKKL